MFHVSSYSLYGIMVQGMITAQRQQSCIVSAHGQPSDSIVMPVALDYGSDQVSQILNNRTLCRIYLVLLAHQCQALNVLTWYICE